MGKLKAVGKAVGASVLIGKTLINPVEVLADAYVSIGGGVASQDTDFTQGTYGNGFVGGVGFGADNNIFDIGTNYRYVSSLGKEEEWLDEWGTRRDDDERDSNNRRDMKREEGNRLSGHQFEGFANIKIPVGRNTSIYFGGIFGYKNMTEILDKSQQELRSWSREPRGPSYDSEIPKGKQSFTYYGGSFGIEIPLSERLSICGEGRFTKTDNKDYKCDEPSAWIKAKIYLDRVVPKKRKARY